MNQSQHSYIDKLDIALDRMLVSEAFRDKAKASGLIELLVAARLIENDHPQLSVISKHLIREQMLTALDEQAITPDDNAKINALLEDSVAHSPSSDARSRMFAKMMAATPIDKPEITLSSDAKQRMLSPMLEAQRKLQIDALVTSDEALEIAKSSDDPMVQAAVALRTAKHPQLLSASKQQILQQILPLEKQHKPILIPNFVPSLQRLIASILIVLFASLLIAPSASADSLPGDNLYTIKRGVETISLRLALSDNQRVRVHLRLANERLDEATRLPVDSQYKPQLLETALIHLESVSSLVGDDITLQNDLSATSIRFEELLVSTDLDEALIVTFTERYQALQPDVTIVTVPEKTDPPVIVPEVTPEVTQAVLVQPDLIVGAEPIILYGYASALINVRIAPLIYAEIITQIEPLQAVTLIDMTPDELWTQVELEDGQIGWIASFLLADAPITPPIVEAPTNLSEDMPTIEMSQQPTGGIADSTQGNANIPTTTINPDTRGNATGNATGNSAGNRQDDDNHDNDDDDDDDD